MFDRLLEIERRWAILPAGFWRGDDRGPPDCRHRVVIDAPPAPPRAICCSDAIDVVEAVRHAPDDVAWMIAEIRRLRDERDALQAELDGETLVGKSRERGDITLATFKIEKPKKE